MDAGEPRRLKARTKEELDAEMDRYMMKDAKTAAQKLDQDLDAYFKTADENEKDDADENENENTDAAAEK